MSNVNQEESAVPTPSHFGKIFGRLLAVVLIILALLAAVVTFSDEGSSPAASQSSRSTRAF